MSTGGFSNAGYDKIIACTMAVNHGSRRVMEKIGMNHVRTDFRDFAAPIPGAEEGEVWYELLRSEWRLTTPRERRAVVGGDS